ncbi:hypothetical protein [Amycolatopsis vancoresmycina]|nr:hypothetical protein [Amycolatopsis vancoresmycina]
MRSYKIDPECILAPDSPAHATAVEEFRSTYGVHPDEAFGADGYVLAITAGRLILGLTDAGLARVRDELAPNRTLYLAWLDQAQAYTKDTLSG